MYIILASFTFDKEPAFQIEFHSLHVRVPTKDPGYLAAFLGDLRPEPRCG